MDVEWLGGPWFAEGGHILYRAVGGMNELAMHLASSLDVRMAKG